MNYWDLLTEDLQEYIINIRDSENEKNKPKIGYYIYKNPNTMIDYYFNIIKVNKKSFNMGYIIINKKSKTYRNAGTSYDLPFNIETTLNGKNTNSYFKNEYCLPIIYIRDLKPISFLDYDEKDNNITIKKLWE